ncbi:SDR family NAD(P)-dependent oxidoreductase [Mycobacterium sp. DL592]|uniref:SDR family NAD(P)-dependent oxidoreductase n=1 Tax=Mycobacterium sp. DL592 TaxID=2675524 RepID=UPI00142283F0|nr:SDR family NAD(P)-dependent oxidoreductase [Mycobacterium sp. DL592]
MSGSRWTAADVPDQNGRVAVITGSNTGIGYQTAAVLAGRGAKVVLAVRNLDKGRAARAQILAASPSADVGVQELDLTSLESIRRAAQALQSDYPRIDLLINNAGVAWTPKQTTKDGFELQFGTNHLGHFALTGLLLDSVLAAPAARVVTVSSLAHGTLADIDFSDLQCDRHYSRIAAYARSKLANLLFTYELQRRLGQAGSSTIAVAAHPGVSFTELGRNLPVILQPVTRIVGPLILQSATMGALVLLRAATDPGVSGGQYYGPDGNGERRGHPVVVESSSRSHDVDLQRRLWAVSEELTGVRFPI